MTNSTIKKGLSKLLSTVGAGVIGSALTLVVVTNTTFMQNGEMTPVAQALETSPYTVEQTSTNPLSLADMVEDASKAIVGVANIQSQNNPFSKTAEKGQAGSGSGVIFKKEGDSAYIVTNNHVIENAVEIEVSLENGEKTTAELVGADPLTDLAVLKIDADYAGTILEFGDSDSLRAGEQVVAIGNPLGPDFSRTVTQGIVSAVDRSINVTTSAGKWDLQVIQTDAAINPGNSGGALINTAGELIGINSLKIAERGVEGIGFAIPSNIAIPIIKEMITHGEIERPQLGVNLVDLDQVPQQYLQTLADEIEAGVIVASLDPNSPAAKAGIEVEDVIVAINDTEINNSSELRKALYTGLNIGDKVVLKVYRGDQLKTIEITLESNKTI